MLSLSTVNKSQSHSVLSESIVCLQGEILLSLPVGFSCMLTSSITFVLIAVSKKHVYVNMLNLCLLL